MKPTVDRELCRGTGMCEAMAPTLFTLSDNGLGEPLVTAVHDPEDLDNARTVVECCPTGAVRLVEEAGDAP